MSTLFTILFYPVWIKISIIILFLPGLIHPISSLSPEFTRSNRTNVPPYVYQTRSIQNRNESLLNRSERQSDYYYQQSALSCPINCICDVTSTSGKRRVTCSSGSMTEIPTFEMDPGTQVMVIEGTAERMNEITIGRIFQSFHSLESITIKYSSLPAIGDSSFWPGSNLLQLDLSHNKIKFIRNTDFNGLVNLRTLNLSDNYLTEAPSAVFHYMTNLTKLILSNNKMSKLVPRLFFKLSNLEYLDLSGNPFNPGFILSEDTFKDINNLIVLKIESSNLKRVSLLTYRELVHLKELYLNDNKLSMITAYEFTSLSSLKLLYLDGNQLHIIRDHAFSGLRLIHLGLSRNSLQYLPSCAFCNLMLESLDLSSNKFTTFSSSLLSPLSLTLSVLSVNGNHDLESPSGSFSHLIHPLKRVQVIKAANIGLDDYLPINCFNNLTHLTSLDISSNKLSNISSTWFKQLINIETIDLSNNFLQGIDQPVLDVIDTLASLKAIYLQRNPWICKRCKILPLMDWINSRTPPCYFNVCNRLISPSTETGSSSSSACITCISPENLSGKSLHLITEMDLEFCPDPRVNLQLTSSSSSVGITLSLLVISIVIILILVVTLTMNMKHRAQYYTHEQDDDRGYDFQVTCLDVTDIPSPIRMNNNAVYNVTTLKSMKSKNFKVKNDGHLASFISFITLRTSSNTTTKGHIRTNSDGQRLNNQQQNFQQQESFDENSQSFNHYRTSPVTCNTMGLNTSACIPGENSFTRKFRSFKSPFKCSGHPHHHGRKSSPVSSCNSSSPFDDTLNFSEAGNSNEISPTGTGTRSKHQRF